jgi:hypothetical protein
MALTNAGRDFIAGAIIGNEATLFDNTNAYIGVGDSNAAFSAAQTDLQGTNKFRKGMDTTYPQISGNVITFKSTFSGDEANFAWEEWGVFNAASGGTMLNRLVEYNGTKQSGQTWIFEVDITVEIGA